MFCSRKILQRTPFVTTAIALSLGMALFAWGQTPTIDGYVDADVANTVAVGGTPAPFYITDPSTGNLWRLRAGFGFDTNNNTQIFEKDANGGVGDAAPLQTTISGLTPGEAYGLYVCFLSVPTESWRVRAGVVPGNLTEFQPATPAGRIWSLGLSSVPGSNREQYLGFITNVAADLSGEIVVYIDDGDATVSSGRTWYEGLAVGAPYDAPPPPPPPPLPGGAVEVAPDGAWTWFNDERAIFHQGYLFSGYVLSDGRYGITRFDPATDEASHMIISTSASQQRDDHNNPSITVLPDDRLLIVYSKHNAEGRFYYRTSKVATPASASDWNGENANATPAANTYANTYRLSAETNRIYCFHRCINFNPTITVSANSGTAWEASVPFIATGGGGVRPYPRYCSNHRDRIDLIYTDGHPRDVDNSVYHLYYRNGGFYKTDGSLVKSYTGLPLVHDSGERGSVVYPFTARAWVAGEGPDDFIPGARGWTWDVCYGTNGAPVCVFQVQRDNVTGSGWNHDRIYYYYARWTVAGWQRHFIAHGGRGLYSSEDDYGGGMTIDPEDPSVVYISTNARDPFNLSDIDNVPLADNERYEIYRGVTTDGGLSFSWEQITVDSEIDNLRPIVPENHGQDRCLLWFAGTYSSYTSFDTRVLGLFGSPTAISLSNRTIPARALPGTFVGHLSAAGADAFALEATATGPDSDDFQIVGATNLHTAVWMNDAYKHITILAYSSGTAMATNDFEIVVASSGAGSSAFRVAAEVGDAPAAGGELIGSLYARGGDGSGFTYTITGGRDDLFEITGSSNLTQVASTDAGDVGDIHWVEIQVVDASTTNHLLVAVEVVRGTPAGKLMINR